MRTGGPHNRIYIRFAPKSPAYGFLNRIWGRIYPVYSKVTVYGKPYMNLFSYTDYIRGVYTVLIHGIRGFCPTVYGIYGIRGGGLKN